MTCRCKGTARWIFCSHWTTGPLTSTEFDYQWQVAGKSMGVKPERVELWSDWKWVYLIKDAPL